MSLRQMVRCFDHDFADATELAVMLAIADHAHDDGGGAYPSVAKIAHKVGMSERTVQRRLSDLRDRGILVVEQEATARRPMVYRIDWSKAPVKAEFKPKRRGDKMTPLETLRGDTPDTPRGDNVVTPGVTPVSPEPSIEPSVEPESSAAVAATPAGEASANKDMRPWNAFVRDCAETWNAEKAKGWTELNVGFPGTRAIKVFRDFKAAYGHDYRRALQAFRAGIVRMRTHETWWKDLPGDITFGKIAAKDKLLEASYAAEQHAAPDAPRLAVGHHALFLKEQMPVTILEVKEDACLIYPADTTLADALSIEEPWWVDAHELRPSHHPGGHHGA